MLGFSDNQYQFQGLSGFSCTIFQVMLGFPDNSYQSQGLSGKKI